MTKMYLVRILCGTLDLFITLWEANVGKADEVHYALTKAYDAALSERDRGV